MNSSVASIASAAQQVNAADRAIELPLEVSVAFMAFWLTFSLNAKVARQLSSGSLAVDISQVAAQQAHAQDRAIARENRRLNTHCSWFACECAHAASAQQVMRGLRGDVCNQNE